MTPNRRIIISPHLDDAVLSIGGLIYDWTQAGIPVEIWTIQCGFPKREARSAFVKRIHAKWKFDSAFETVSKRRVEDQYAAAAVGAGVRHFSNTDCIYRRDRDGKLLYTKSIFVPIHPAEKNLPRKLAKEIAAQLSADDQLYCALSVGGHIDHVLTRDAVALLGREVIYYVDVPYILNTPDDLPRRTAGLTPDLYPISKPGLKAWIAGVLAYTSQIEMLFGNAQKTEEAITEYWAREKGVQLWGYN
jgi:LmbE family N-acetylglucosaminyl deacetylase